MGSCFRNKKKNSYTVTQMDEEYIASGGKFQSKSDKRFSTPSKTAGSQGHAPSGHQHPRNVTKHEVRQTEKSRFETNGLHSGKDTTVNQQSSSTSAALPKPDLVNDYDAKKGRNISDASTVSLKSESVTVEVREEEQNREPVSFMTSTSGGSVGITEQDTTVEFSTEEHHSYKEDTIKEEEDVQEILQTTEDISRNDYEEVTLRDDYVAVVSYDDRSRSPSPARDTYEEKTEETVEETPVPDPEPQTSVTFKDTPETINYTPQAFEEQHDHYEHQRGPDSDDEEDTVTTHVQVDTQYHTDPDDGHTTATTTTTTYDYNDLNMGGTSTFVTGNTTEEKTGDDDQLDYGYAKPYEEQDFTPDPAEEEVRRNSLPQYDEVQITDSPAGTWDARLNSAVRAELDEVRRSLNSSRASSNTSLNAIGSPSVTAQGGANDQEDEKHYNVGFTVTATHTTTNSSSENYEQNENDQNDRLEGYEHHVMSDNVTNEVSYEGEHEQSWAPTQYDDKYETFGY